VLSCGPHVWASSPRLTPAQASAVTHNMQWVRPVRRIPSIACGSLESAEGWCGRHRPEQTLPGKGFRPSSPSQMPSRHRRHSGSADRALDFSEPPIMGTSGLGQTIAQTGLGLLLRQTWATSTCHHRLAKHSNHHQQQQLSSRFPHRPNQLPH